MREIEGTTPRLKAMRATAGASAVTILAMLPVFLLGALAVLVRGELGFDEAALGVTVAAFFLASALASVPGGRLSDRLGARPSILLSSTGTLVALVGITTLARDWLTLTLLMAVAGASGGMTQPAANLLLTREIPPRRQGVAFGAMKAAAPAATLLAGLAIPALGLTLGWRWAFVAAWVVGIGALSLLGLSGIRPERQPSVTTHIARPPTGPLVMLSIALGCASAAITSMGVFFVEYAVRLAIDLRLAGLLLAAGSATGVVARLLVGWIADIRGRGLLVGVTSLLLTGAGAAVLLAVARGPGAIAVAAVIGFGPGWAWPGLFNLAVVRHAQDSPAAAIGITQTGGHLGAVAGPVVFGLLVTAHSYRAAWLAAATSTVVAAALALGARHRLARFNR